jgi:DMSO/TMAO reductase YedYZ molybdopterin-dependent catalytic subunit
MTPSFPSTETSAPPTSSSRSTARPSRRRVLQAGAAGAALLGSGGLTFTPAARAAGGPIVKPLPPDWFIDYGTNAEMRWSSVYDQGYITSNDRFFVRDHTSTPTIDAATYTLKLHGDGLVGAPGLEDAVELTYADLSAMPQRTITSFVECTGNGRSFFGSQQGTPAAGTPWTLGAIGVATWTGVPLRTVLSLAGLTSQAVDVMAVGLDAPYVSGGVDYGRVRRPIPIEKALDDTLVVLKINGETLPPDSGFPVRLLVPGWVGIASIKWLGELEVSTQRLTSPWNTKWYRMTGPSYPADSPPLTVVPVKSAFELERGAELPARQRTLLQGRSWSGSSPIAKVEVSLDGGRHWRRPRLLGPNDAHTWVQWEIPWVPPARGEYELLARATDRDGRRQPDTVPFNDNGYFFWAVVRHPVTAV